MAKTPPQKPTSTPDDFPQVEPQELFPTNNIRFVMWETAKLTERVEGLSKTIDGLSPKLDKTVDRYAADTKERIADLKDSVKTTTDQVASLKGSIDSFKGAMKVFAGLYALALIVLGAFFTWYLRPTPMTPPAVIPAPTSELTSDDPVGGRQVETQTR